MTTLLDAAKIALCNIVIAAALGAPTSAHAQQTKETRTYTLIVAYNGSVDEGVQPLKYADDDGARYYETFSHLTDETTLLTVLDADSQRVFPELAPRTRPPTRAELEEAVEDLARKLDADRAAGIHAEVYLVFTGHGNIDETGEGYLSLADGKLRRSDLYRDVIRPLDADYTHLIIDACHAYFMVQSRGGGDWRDDRSGQTHDEEWRAYLQSKPTKTEQTSALSSTVGVILSTSGTAEVHEWSKLRAGVFSHQLRSGLLGAADVNADGKVEYIELEAFLAAANAGVTNPKAKISVFARPPAQDQRRALVNLSDFEEATFLELPRDMHGRYHVEDARGLRYADVNLSATHATTLALLRGPVDGRDYYLRREDEELASVPLATETIDAGGLQFAAVEDMARSSVEESFRADLFSTPFGPGFFSGYVASRARYDAMLSEQTARDLASQKTWRVDLDLGYATSQPALSELDGVQHNLTLSVPVQLRGLNIGPFISYGYSNHQGIATPADVHRAALGAQLGWRLNAGKLWFEPRARLGQQLLLFNNEEICGEAGPCADPIGLRAEAAGSIGYQLDPRVAIRVEAGAAIDVISRANSTRNEETLEITPTLGVGLRF